MYIFYLAKLYTVVGHETQFKSKMCMYLCGEGGGDFKDTFSIGII